MDRIINNHNIYINNYANKKLENKLFLIKMRANNYLLKKNNSFNDNFPF